MIFVKVIIQSDDWPRVTKPSSTHAHPLSDYSHWFIHPHLDCTYLRLVLKWANQLIQKTG